MINIIKIGHKRIETTEKYYISSTDEDHKQITKSFEKSLTLIKIYEKEDK